MTTRTVTTKSMVGVLDKGYIRAITLTLNATNCRPNCRMNVFFENMNLNHVATPSGGSLGDPLMTDSNGAIQLTINVPGGTFPTGTSIIKITDAHSLSDLVVNGNQYGVAQSTYTTKIAIEQYQTTNDIYNSTTNTVDSVLPSPDILYGQNPQDQFRQYLSERFAENVVAAIIDSVDKVNTDNFDQAFSALNITDPKSQAYYRGMYYARKDDNGNWDFVAKQDESYTSTDMSVANFALGSGFNINNYLNTTNNSDGTLYGEPNQSQALWNVFGNSETDSVMSYFGGPVGTPDSNDSGADSFSNSQNQYTPGTGSGD